MLFLNHFPALTIPVLPAALYRARLIEHWGTGTLRIIRACGEANIKVDFFDPSRFVCCPPAENASPARRRDR